MLSSAFLIASRSPRMRNAIESGRVTRHVVSRFVPGQAIPDAVAATRELSDDGRLVTLDVLGEDVTDIAGARTIRDSYLELLRALGGAGLRGDRRRLPQAHGPRAGAARVRSPRRARPRPPDLRGRPVRGVHRHPGHGGPHHRRLDAIGAELRSEFADVGNVLQSNLRRTPGDLAQLSDSGARIRLVKGAYREPASVAHQRKSDVDFAYAADITTLMSSSCYPMIATHDPRMLAHATTTALARRRTAEAWETQVPVRLLIQTGRRIEELGQDDLDELAEACHQRTQRTGTSHRHYPSAISNTQTVLFHLGVVDGAPRSGGPLEQRLAQVAAPIRAELIGYLERKRATCHAKTVSAMPTRLKHFGVFLTTIDSDLRTVQDLDRRHHIEPWLASLLDVVSEKDGAPISIGDHNRRVVAVSTFLTDITEWAGTPPQPGKSSSATTSPSSPKRCRATFPSTLPDA